MQEEILKRKDSFKHAKTFEGTNYILEDSDFGISGFNPINVTSSHTVEIKRVERDQIIGNSEAMGPLFSAIEKLWLYDVDEQMNPIVSLGKFPGVIGLDGDPGNGKTLAGAAGATYFQDLATEMGLPHKVMVIPSFVDKYQGESDKAAKRWCKEFMDPRTIKFGIGDEFEQVVPDHGDEDSSEGAKGVATAFLKAFDGVETIERGHSVFIWMSNYRELIDKAWLSRTNMRAFVGGAETLDDYVRFIVLMLKKVNNNFPDLVNFENVNWDMDLRAPQVLDKDADMFVDPSASVDEVYKMAMNLHEPDDIMFLARFFWLMKKRFKAFSLRDCKNAIDSAKAQVSNFNVPKEFTSNAATYQEQPFDQKKGLLTELAREHVKDMKTDFVSLVNERALYYAGDALRTADVKHNRAVEEVANNMLVNEDALKKLGEIKRKRNSNN